ncbi:Methyltransferase domain-containing protein [Tistlia consotensis]|uniref:Methyltransferase domain-containing protein n=1 Tax=Tistlia consotensis USBA 355 TaxID=560819 RepID=A0A1Y6BK49_9PROT|nr:class I SAM-dependent methyltransferase [Tistlia consotensis]SMF05300.1 Methyltransferase domain-containing protein [Tistlia consotensis USBA 355]SNR55207.1 Methyltransferase domain-containing protein [Tistlia consotensis]
MDFAPFDRRGYPTLAVREGYGEWAASYDGVVQDVMDIRLLERLRERDWTAAGTVLDLACGTGRIGAWLRGRGAGRAGIERLDGLDFTPEMLARAAARGVYDALFAGDVRDTGLPAGSYDLVLQVLAEEHLPDLAPLYRETFRLARPGGAFLLVGYHPHFLMSGIPTHFDRPDGQSMTIESHVHLTSDHVKAAQAAGWRLEAMDEGLVDQDWLAVKPKWRAFLHHPVSYLLLWRKAV